MLEKLDTICQKPMTMRAGSATMSRNRCTRLGLSTRTCTTEALSWPLAPESEGAMPMRSDERRKAEVRRAESVDSRADARPSRGRGGGGGGASTTLWRSDLVTDARVDAMPRCPAERGR